MLLNVETAMLSQIYMFESLLHIASKMILPDDAICNKNFSPDILLIFWHKASRISLKERLQKLLG